MKDVQGPDLFALTRRLSETPPDFLDEPKMGRRGIVRVDAVVSDLILDLGGGPPDENELTAFATSEPDQRNRLRLCLIACWVLGDQWFVQNRPGPRAVLGLLGQGLADLADLMDAEMFVTDPGRREELVRLILSALGLRPSGETQKQAQDRLASLDSVDRARVIRDTREKQERARKLRKQMEEQKAREAAARWNRE